MPRPNSVPRLVSMTDKTNAILIPARFVITTGHLLAMTSVMQTLNNNTKTSLMDQNSRSSDFESLNQLAASAIALAYFCFAIDIIGLLMGLSIFNKKVNLFHVVIHFAGSVLTCWFIGEYWCVGSFCVILSDEILTSYHTISI